MKKVFAILIVAMICSVISYAQNLKEHVVAKGETLESIAQQYGITVAKIQEVNPNVKNYIYVGQKINIPVVEPQALLKPETTPTTTVQNTYIKNTSHSTSMVDDIFGYMGAIYINPSLDNNAKYGYYGLGWSIIYTGGVGVNFGITYGPKTEIMRDHIGLSYSDRISDNVFWSIPVNTILYISFEGSKTKCKWGGISTGADLIVNLFENVFLCVGPRLSYSFRSQAKVYLGGQVTLGIDVF